MLRNYPPLWTDLRGFTSSSYWILEDPPDLRAPSHLPQKICPISFHDQHGTFRRSKLQEKKWCRCCRKQLPSPQREWVARESPESRISTNFVSPLVGQAQLRPWKHQVMGDFSWCVHISWFPAAAWLGPTLQMSQSGRTSRTLTHTQCSYVLNDHLHRQKYTVSYSLE